MKKEYISPFTKMVGTSIDVKILEGSQGKTQGFGNSTGGTSPDVESGLGEGEGDGIIGISKRRNSFYE